MSLAISLFITILMIYSGFQGIDPNKVKLAQTFGASKAQILTKVVLAGKRSDPDRDAQGERRPVAGRRRRRRVPVGQHGARLSHPVRQPDFQMNIVMTAITILAIVSSLMYLAISWLEAAVMRRR